MNPFGADEPVEAESPAREAEPPAGPPPVAAPSRPPVRAVVRATGALLRGFWRLPGRAQLHLALLAMAMTVVVVALVMLGPGPDDRAGIASAAVFPRSSATPAAPRPMSPADYQLLLTALGRSIGAGLSQIGAAQNPQAVATAASALDHQLLANQSGLLAGPPPPGEAGANIALVDALQELSHGDGVSALLVAANRNSVCLGSSATALLSRSTGMAELRAAIGALTGNGRYHVALTLPPVTPDPSRALADGAIVDGARGTGLGDLTVTNGGSTDATVGLVPDQGGRPMVTVYVGHGRTYTLHGVPDGTYQVYVMTGSDWDSGAVAFGRDCDFWRFDQTMRFVTTSRDYTTYTLTLTPAPNGQATSTEVDPNAFPR